MKVIFRKFHRQVAPILFFPLLASALTGVAYSVGKNWLGVHNSLTNLFIAIHQGNYLGEKLVPIYVLLVGLGLVGMSVTGLMLINHSHSQVNSQQTQKSYRSIHRFIALIFLLPFAVSAETGVLYRLGTDWFGMSSQQTAILLKIHRGGYLGANFSVFYILLIGSGLITLLITGIKMTSLGKITILPKQWWQLSPKSVASESDLTEIITSLRKKAWLGIGIFSLFFIVIVDAATSIILSKKYANLPDNLPEKVASQSSSYFLHFFLHLLFPIVILALILAAAAFIITEKLIQYWRRQKEIEASLYKSEATSHTILKAVPDSMLRIHQDGTCLSYIPAKEAESFLLKGDILGKHVTDFLPPTIAQKLLKYTKLALQSGATHTYQFTSTVRGGKQNQEARISAIGETEVLIMIRQIADLEQIYVEKDELSDTHGDMSVRVVSQSELIQQLEVMLEDPKKYAQHHVLCYLAVARQDTIRAQHGERAVNNLLEQIATKVEAYLPYTSQIACLDSNELALLLRDYSLEQASILAEQLRQDLNGFLFQWHGDEYSISVSIGVVEIDADSSDVASVMSAAEAACSIAKQNPPSASQNVVLIRYAK
ncbi:MAG: GGDEF domain-containing protein [Xenococcaceae cyanobacterium MO_188.B32]|nr:GGDEF domain-containing protein [Xenococcaceae cyanobacterium MO_188.B32]